MKNTLKIASLVFAFSALSSCSLFDLDGNLENPNEVGTGNLDVTLLNNKIQMDFADFCAEVSTQVSSSGPTMELTRMIAMTNGDVYERAYQSQNLNAIWNRGYQDVLVNIETLLGKTDGTGLVVHSAQGRILKAYVYLTLVDLFNDVPFSEAVSGLSGNFNPKVDGGASVYAAAITLLDEANALLATTATGTLARDIYYGGSAAKWNALANTLKLKAYMNLSLSDASAKGKIEALLAADLIDTDGEEFTYKYGTADDPARSRHPMYRQMYKPQAGDADNYLGNYFMFAAYKQKGVEDPRWRYYFYRQVGSIAKGLADDPKSIPCLTAPRPGHYGPDVPFCAFDPGFYGRDHGNNDGVPPDTRAKTCVGVYPAGGLADVNEVADFQKVTAQGQGANGAGITPIWMASFTDFVKAEAYARLGVSGDAKAALLSGVNKSIARVQKFGADKGQAVPAAITPSTTAYVDAVTALYDAASTTDAKMQVIGKEYYLTLWGNGIEAYNLYRRTGKPGDLQPMRSITPGTFWYSLIYPSVFADLNSNATQKSPTTINKVFWDTNGDICK